MLRFFIGHPVWSAVALTTVASMFAGASGRGERMLGEKDSGSAVALVVGETLRIQLPGNPTTGFTWMIDSVDATVLKTDAEPAFESSNELLGGGGHFTTALRAVAPGKTTLKMVYRRPWEKEVAPAKAFVVDISVSANPSSSGQTQE